jgi:hypothetical protein
VSSVHYSQYLVRLIQVPRRVDGTGNTVLFKLPVLSFQAFRSADLRPPATSKSSPSLSVPPPPQRHSSTSSTIDDTTTYDLIYYNYSPTHNFYNHFSYSSTTSTPRFYNPPSPCNLQSSTKIAFQSLLPQNTFNLPPHLVVALPKQTHRRWTTLPTRRVLKFVPFFNSTNPRASTLDKVFQKLHSRARGTYPKLNHANRNKGDIRLLVTRHRHPTTTCSDRHTTHKRPRQALPNNSGTILIPNHLSFFNLCHYCCAVQPA